MNTLRLALTLLAALDPSASVAQQPALGGSAAVASPAPATAQSEASSGDVTTQQPAAPLGSPDPNEVRADAIQDFRGQLAPYGNWVEDPSYGTLWIPSTQYVGADFVPYTTGGHWAYGSDYVWNSTYAFSDAPFHYGRWTWVTAYGWSWVPGAVYRGAWVSWRTDPLGYVGWAPLGPSYYWFGGSARWIYGSAYYAPYSYCHRSSLFAPNVGAFVVRGPDAGRIAHRATTFAPPAYPSSTGAGTSGGPGQGRTYAAPTLGSPQPATPTLASPSPSALGLSPSAVTKAGPVRMAESAAAQAPALAPRPALTFTPPSYAAPQATLPAYRPAPTFTPPSYRPAPTFTPQAQAPSYAPAPTFTPPSYRPAPTFTPPSYSQPRFSAPSAPSGPSSPSYSQPRFSAPIAPSSPSYNQPRFSAPSMGGMRRR